jgi:hypothetical protein
MAFAQSSYILSQARVFIVERAFNGPDIGALDWVGDADNVDLTVSQKTDKIKESYTGKGLTAANPVTETDCMLKINVLDMKLQNWAMATWGDDSGAKAGGSVTGESIVLFNGKYVKLANIGVSNVVVAGAVLNTDYVLDTAAHGMLRVLPGSSAAPVGIPFTIMVAYDYAANNGKVEAFVLGQKFYRIVVAGLNTAQGNQPTILEVRQVQLEMAKKFDFIGKKHMAFELGGELLIDGSRPLATEVGDLSQFFSFEKA